MSEAYKQKEYELRSAIDNISSIPYVFENYVEETENFIDRLLDDTKEINTLRNQLQQKENIIKEVEKFVEEVLSSTKGVINDYMYHKEHNKERIELLEEDIEIYKRILEILDKVDKGE